MGRKIKIKDGIKCRGCNHLLLNRIDGYKYCWIGHKEFCGNKRTTIYSGVSIDR